jgi:hypothetical protein
VPGKIGKGDLYYSKGFVRIGACKSGSAGLINLWFSYRSGSAESKGIRNANFGSAESKRLRERSGWTRTEGIVSLAAAPVESSTLNITYK